VTDAKLPKLPEPVAHVHSNGEFCYDVQVFSELWPVSLYTESQLSAFAERVRQDERERPIDLSDYINAAKINGSDAPHVVVEKLQAAIDAAMVQQVQERAE
jgi:hypothetical protein